MKERPILMSAPMVRALLDGSKTQTRRAVKPQPPEGTYQVSTWHHPDPRPHFFAWQDLPHDTAMTADGWFQPCPYGQPGEQLWVREAWARTTVAGQEWVVYREGDNRTDYGGPWKPSIHMFRKDSRITLEIVSVRVERLQEISEDDCWAEGIEQVMHDFDEVSQCHMANRLKLCIDDAKPLYAQLWESINGPGSWDLNPWVWCVEFKRITA